MKLTINIPNPYKVWKNNRKVILTKRQAQMISTVLYDYRLSPSGDTFVFGKDYIQNLEDIMDAQIFDGHVYRYQKLVKIGELNA
jgi:hypothetical protein